MNATSCLSAVMPGTAAHHEFQELPFIMSVMIYRTAVPREFLELSFHMDVRTAVPCACHELRSARWYGASVQLGRLKIRSA